MRLDLAIVIPLAATAVAVLIGWRRPATWIGATMLLSLALLAVLLKVRHGQTEAAR
jgi:hypothetical protein